MTWLHTWLGCKHFTRISCYSSGTSASYTNIWTKLWQTTQMLPVKVIGKFHESEICREVYFSYVHSMKSGISRQEIDKEKQSYLLNGLCFHWLSGMANISYGCLNHQLQASKHVQNLSVWKLYCVLAGERGLRYSGAQPPGPGMLLISPWQWSNVAQWCSKVETHSFGSN